ncbi:MAG: hypothetical protein RBR20_02100 [Desulfobacterales bacterium]|jgi:hypothetical protein|nr:hypothetical protein [Desulfobacterales bacterium]
MTNSESTSDRINRYYLTLKTYVIDPRYLDTPGSRLGDGIDLNDPLLPKAAPFTAFKLAVQATAEDYELPKSDDLIDEAFHYSESLTEREEANVLSTSFKASYGLSSLQGAYEAAKKEKESYHTIYAILEHSGEAKRLHDESLHWKVDEIPSWESLSNPDDVLFEFVEGYGSHYIRAITYGLRIAVQGKLRKDSQENSQTFSTTFKAAFGSFGAEASVRNEHIKKLESMDVKILLEATSGGHTGGLLSLQSFNEIAKFFDDVKNNKIQFRVAPIKLNLSSYRPTLPRDWKKTRDALDSRLASFKTPSAPYGVPKGTIIAWHPTSDYVEGLDSKDQAEVKIVPPSGWAICDGKLGTPDLRGRFIRGTEKWAPTPPTGGSEEHAHGGETKKNTAKRGAHGGAGSKYKQPAEEHTHAIDIDNNLPPYAELVYIMKMDDLL